MDKATCALIYEALRFSLWAAGEGLSPADGENAMSPEDFFLAYSKKTGDQDWDVLPHKIVAMLAR